jgi:hypothetical protein
MGQENLPRATTVPEFWKGNEEEHRRKMSQAINQIQKGVTNNHYTVTLSANATTTEVRHPPARSGSGVQITPKTASAAASLAAGGIFVETETGKAIIHHDASAATDRIFHLAFFG